MNVLKQYYFFCLIAINCFTFFAYQEVPTVIFHVDSFQSEPSRSNIKYGIRTEYNILSYDQSEYYAPYHKEYYASFSTQDFQQAFQDISDINEILNQYPLYAFKNFLEFARPFPEYEIHIILLYEKIKNDKTFRKQTASMPYFTYSFGLRHEKSGFHDFVATEAQRIISIQQQRKISKTQQTMYSMPQDGDVLAEYTALSNLGKDHPPCLSLALKKRVKAIKSMIRCDHALQYINKSYDLNDNVKQLLKKYGYDITCFTQSYGHHLRHTIHQESLDLLNRIDTLSSDSILYDHQEALVDFTVAMANYNHENETDKALHIGDFCWTLLDYGQAIAEGIVLGAYSAATDLLHNPLEASLNIIIGKQVLAYQLCKVLFNVADISITALISTDQAKNKWYKYTEPLNNIINHINEKNLSMRDLLKGGTAFIVGYKAQSTFFNGLGKFCNTIQQK